MKIEDWFDPYDKSHINAYNELMNTGTWPKNFVPADVEFKTSWNLLLRVKMVDCWVKYVLENKEVK